MKRQRGRGRKPGGGSGGGGGGNHGNHGNRSLESNGPEVKIRGTAAQIYEKYMQYARDGQSGGDRVKYENYLQHAEHYFRIMAATMPRERMQQISDNGGQQQLDQNTQDQRSEEGNADPMKVIDESDDQGDEPEGDEVEARDSRDNRDEDEPEGDAQASGGQQGDREGGGRNRRRRRRNRDGQRPDGGGNGGGPSGGSDPEARSALDALAAKQGALAGG